MSHTRSRLRCALSFVRISVNVGRDESRPLRGCDQICYNLHMYDAIIIGGGPAGLAATVYFARQKLNFLLLASEVGGQALWSNDVEDYLGFHLLDGGALVKRFQEHLADYVGTYDVRENQKATSIDQIPSGFRVKTDEASYEARSVLIATGSKRRELNVPGEKEFSGKGVTYCATCDAPLFKGKKVYIIGGGNSAMDAALFLEKYTTDIGLVTLNATLMGDTVMMQRVTSSPNIKVLVSTKTSKVVGTQFVEGVGLIGPDGVERVEPCAGVFIEIGLVPSSQFVTLAQKDQWGQIIVDKRNQTSVPGLFAAGDVTDVTEKQIAIAVGEGSKAALEMIAYLQKTKEAS